MKNEESKATLEATLERLLDYADELNEERRSLRHRLEDLDREYESLKYEVKNLRRAIEE